MEKITFSFENLDVWQKAIEFADMVISSIDNIQVDRKHYRLIEQIEASSASIAMNIAEGKGRFSKKEFIQFLYIARGSLFETITLLTLFNKRGWIDYNQFCKFRNEGDKIGKMLSSLISALKNQRP